MLNTNELVLKDVAAGDANAARRCIDMFGPLVWSLARRSCPTAADAEDAVQEIFLSVYKSASRFDPEHTSEAGFVAMIARRRLIDYARQRGRRGDHVELNTVLETLVAPADPGSFVSSRFEAVHVAYSFASLRLEQRQVLWLSTVEGFSQSEIAKQTGMPLGTVKVHARRGLLRLRELFFGPQQHTSHVALEVSAHPHEEVGS